MFNTFNHSEENVTVKVKQANVAEAARFHREVEKDVKANILQQFRCKMNVVEDIVVTICDEPGTLMRTVYLKFKINSKTFEHSKSFDYGELFASETSGWMRQVVIEALEEIIICALPSPLIKAV